MRALLASLLTIGALLAPPADARDAAPAVIDALQADEIRLDQLPNEAQVTLALIKRGGPFPYGRDGTVFGNREQRLPARPRGYYTEYTVRTPQRSDRGPRRIVAGGGRHNDPATSGEYYYTEDHYNSFRRIRE